MTEVSGQPGAGAGLKKMQKRIRMISGRFSMETETGKGTRIAVRLPMGRAEPVNPAAPAGA